MSGSARRARTRRLVASTVAFLLLSGGLRAEEEAPAEPPVAGEEQEDIEALIHGWIADLRKNEFELRERAREALRARGAEAPEVLAQYRDDEDAEVARLVAGILEASGAAVEQGPPGDLTALGRLTVSEAGTTRPLSAWFETLGLGIVGFDLPAAGRDRSVSLPTGAIDWGDAYLRLLRAGGLRATAPLAAGRPHALEAAPAEAPVLPAGFAGPFVAHVEEVTATRVLAGGKPPSYQLGLLVQWPAFVQLIQHQAPQVKRLEAQDGSAFGPLPKPPNMNYGIGTHQSHRKMSVLFSRGQAEKAEHLGAIDVEVPVHVRHDLAQASFALDAELPICLDGEGEAAKPGTAGSVRLHAVVPPEEGQRGPWRFELDGVFESDLERQSMRLFAVWSDGDPAIQRIHATSTRPAGADGHVNLTARAWARGGAAGAPARLIVQWFRRESRGTLSFTLEDIPLR